MADLSVTLTHPPRTENNVAVRRSRALACQHLDAAPLCPLDVDAPVADLGEIVSESPTTVRTLLLATDKHDTALVGLDRDVTVKSCAE